MTAPWRCPVCRLALRREPGRFVCADGHAFDIAREGYVNLVGGSGRRRPAGDSLDMVRARAAFLASGAFEPLSDRVNEACTAMLAPVAGIRRPPVILDVGCGEGYYTRRLGAALTRLDGAGPPVTVAGIDIAKPAVAMAARRHPAGCYAVASAFDVPVLPRSIDVVLSVFGPVAPDELTRIVGTGGALVAVHPGEGHLFTLRSLVYDRPEPHEVKDPLRGVPRFRPQASLAVRYPLVITDASQALQLLTMTPYRWHAPRDIAERLTAAGGLDTEVDVVLSSYRRTD